MEWTWDERKAAVNRTKHGISFGNALLVFDDPWQFSAPDPHEHDDRWQTIGWVDGLILFVVHTWPDAGEPGRIISARRASPTERMAYGKQHS